MDCLNISILILTVIALAFGLSVIINDSLDEKQKVRRSGIIQFIVLVLLALVTFNSAMKDGQQKNRIERLAEVDSSIGKHTETLSLIDNQLDSHIKKAVEIDTALAALNISLTKKANDSIVQLKELNSEIKLLMNSLNLKTDQEFVVSGEFNFSIDSSLANMTQIKSFTGRKASDFNLAELRDHNLHQLSGGTTYFKVFVLNLKVYVVAVVRDLNGNIIAEIENNQWRINKNACSKFNYDDKGFEVFDNTGRVVLSINIVGTSIYTQGMLVTNDNVELLGVNSPDNLSFKCGTPELNKIVYGYYDRYPIKQLFLYSGPKWHGMRMLPNSNNK